MHISKRFVLSVFVVASLFILVSLIPSTVRAQTSSISIWWPTDNATVAAVQPFKALVDGLPVEQYKMYWQVDGGQLNEMPSNYADAPHKETSVDLSGWHWSSSGAYAINFVAKNSSGALIAQRQVTIHTNVPATPIVAAPIIVQAAPVASSAPASAPIVVQTVSTPIAAPSPVIPAPSSVNVWWPTNAVTVTGTQPFKAVLVNTSLSAYSMYWQVDDGQLNKMSDSNTDSPHKESIVDLSGWSWHGTGPYVLTFVAKNSAGSELGKTSITIYTGLHSVATTPTPTLSVSPSPSVVPTPSTAPVSPSNPFVAGNPLSGLSFYVDPNSNAATQVKAWSVSQPGNAVLISKIASQSQANWLGDWNANIYADAKAYVDAAASKGTVPVLVAYDIPQRDCGSYSAGGANSAAGYKSWISSLASAIGTRKAVVILEPDALAMIDCLSSADQATRYSLLNYAVSTLKANSHTLVYLDAGNSNWVGAGTMSGRLQSAGIAKADGFALNVSNYYWTQDNVNYGQSLSSQVGGKHFVVDTSRNGVGPDGGNWCNPSGRALGAKPTTQTGNSLVDAFLWLKRPGESDGACNGGPSAGVWWADAALGMAQRAGY